MTQGNVIAFAGPCLPARPDRQWRELLAGVDVRPPARRGDVLAALAETPESIVLLDGLYYTVPSVSHQELLYAVDAGVLVIGAASMGALRAAELESDGMVGVGKIFQWYRDGALDGDDEVALLHLDRSFAYRHLTIALVEIRWALDGLAPPGRRPPEFDEFVDDVKALPFTRRSSSAVASLAESHLGAALAQALRDSLESTSLKEADGQQALWRAKHERSSSTRRGRRATTFLSIFREQYTRLPRVMTARSSRPVLLETWLTFQVLHPQAADFVDWVRERFLLAALAVQQALRTEADELEWLVQDLADRLSRQFATPPLLDVELAEEAQVRSLARRALERFGGVDRALMELAGSLGLDPRRPRGQLMRLLETEPELLTSWEYMRAFPFCSAFSESVATAGAAAEVHDCFKDWACGARVLRQDLVELSAEVWECHSEDVIREAARRALFDYRGQAPGYWEAMELLAPAERLPRPVNDYVECRSRLVSKVLEVTAERSTLLDDMRAPVS